ncbi:MAG: cobaltochelatase subunit CobN [Deltaproteobacteria bacterium]|nr:cobaltochelatase subunit CobN [Deltaproteobacteria bacterium]
MSPRKLVVYSSGNMGLGNLGRAAAHLARDHPGRLQVLARSQADLFDRSRQRAFLDAVGGADLVMLFMHGGKLSLPLFDQVLEAVQGREIYIHPSDQAETELSRAHSTAWDGDAFQRWVLYLKHGGQSNWYNLLREVVGLPSDAPAPLPCQALYHPRLGAVENLTDYLHGLGLTLAQLADGRPVVGVWFNQFYWVEGDLQFLDTLLAQLEAQGAVPLCCFQRRYPDSLLEVAGTGWLIDHYFCHQGRRLIHALISPMMFNLALTRPDESARLAALGVPVIQAVNVLTTRQAWWESARGLSAMDLCISVAQPELDGNLITVPLAFRETRGLDPLTGAALTRMEPDAERLAKMVRLTLNWARLALKTPREKRVAIVFHNYPPRNDKIGCAYGLDSFASVVRLVERLHQEGYLVEKVYEDAQELADILVSGLTNDQRWLLPEQMAGQACASAGPAQLAAWRAQLPPANQARLDQDWGPSPGELFVHQGRVLINGTLNGNLYLGVQPPRGFLEQPERIHDPHLSPSHHYLYYYRWLRDEFRADAVVHVGKHGSLEWLPGKSAGLGPECYPDLAIMELPNLYPYIINDPGEGTQAKRRAHACIVDHLIPVMTNADLYEELAQIDAKVLEYMQTRDLNPTRLPLLQEQLWELVAESHLDRDLGWSRPEALDDFEEFLEKLHAYLSEVGDTAIADGLHTLGLTPSGEALVELTTQLVRLRNAGAPSLREAVAGHWGYAYEALLARRGAPDASGRFASHAQALEVIHQTCREIVAAAWAGQAHPLTAESPAVAEVAAFLHETVLPKLAATPAEIEACLAGLAGRFVPPGPSGAPTRGQVDILPTGRNFFSVDPQKLPSSGAWRVGMALGDDLVTRYMAETGAPPQQVGLVLWGGPTMRTQGEDLAEALYLMGIRPRWNPQNGRVLGVEPIPLAELKFPRLDVTVRASGLFRDSFPNLVKLLDQAVSQAALLQEPPEANLLRRNVVREAAELARRGRDPGEAWREASFRVFSDPPGAYGAGVAAAIDAKAWDSPADLGEVWITYGGYAYGQDAYGAPQKEAFRRRLEDISLVVKNEDSREYDLLSSDDFNAYFGGFVCAVKTVSGVAPRAYAGDASDPDRVRNRSLQEEAKHVFRSRILNPKWISGLMRHGFKGAGDLSRTVDNAFHWDATSGVIDDWMYEGLARRYAFDPQMQKWLREVNPYALQNISERLLEAIKREMWHTDQETEQRLEEIYLEVEGDIEDFSL